MGTAGSERLVDVVSFPENKISLSTVMWMQVRSYGAGFIFTTSLPLTFLAGAFASIRLLRYLFVIHHGFPHPHLVSQE